MSNPDSLQKLLRNLQQVPYLASKNLYKVANYFLEQDQERVIQLCQSLLEAKQKIQPCARCFTWQQLDSPCGFCDSSKRDQSLICVVEKWPDLLAIERTSHYQGVYHVLGGVISPLNGVRLEHLTVQFLLHRVQAGTVQELVLALSPTPEGEATMAYLIDKLQGYNLKISGLAQGLPVGSALEYMDRVTLSKALADRRSLL
jgi:recombination protein RecR